MHSQSAQTAKSYTYKRIHKNPALLKVDSILTVTCPFLKDRKDYTKPLLLLCKEELKKNTLCRKTLGGT